MLGVNRLGIIASARRKPADVPVVSGPPDYLNRGGMHDRSEIIAVTTNMTAFGPVAGIVDGTTQAETYFDGAAGWWLDFDFGVGVKKRITEFRWKQHVVSARGDVFLQGSDDKSSWTDVHGPFDLGTSTTTTIAFANTNFYRYYRLTSPTNTFTNAPYIFEVEFQIAEQGGEPTATSYGHYGGAGDRTGQMVVTQKSGQSGGPPAALINGLIDNVYDWGAGQSDAFLTFDFGTPLVIDEFNWLQSLGNPHGTWKWQGSNDGSAFVDLGSTFTLGDGTNQFQALTPAPGGYRYYRLQQVSGETSFLPWLQEIRFKTAAPAA